MAKAFGQIRAAAQLLIRAAASQKLSAAETIRQLTDKGLTYRRTDMLADWRSAGNIEAKTGLLRFVRKDYVPSARVIADVTWQTSREFMYKVRVETRIRPGEPLETKFVNIMADTPMTPRQLETEITQSWGSWYPERRENIEAVIPETAIRRV